MASFLHVSPPEPCRHLSSPPYMLHVPHPSQSSSFSHSNNIRRGIQIIKRCRVHFPLNPLLLPLPLAQISPSATYSRTSFAHVLPSVCENELPVHTKQQANYCFTYFNLYILASKREDKVSCAQW